MTQIVTTLTDAKHFALQKKELQNPLTQFLVDKYSKANEGETDLFEKYPVQWTDDDNILRKGFLQDANVTTLTIKKEEKVMQVYNMEAIVLSEDLTHYYSIKKKCVAEANCAINWDTLNCTQVIESVPIAA